MSLAIVTASYGGYDTPKALPQDLKGVEEAVMVTDNKDTLRAAAGMGYRCVLLERNWLSPREASKLPKFRPDLFTGAEHSLWLDSSMQLKESDLSDIVDLLGENWMAVHAHELRTTLSAELRESLPHPSYSGQPLAEQVHSYLAQGYPEEWGLWELGFVLRRHCPEQRIFGNVWMEEVISWTTQDQLSFSAVSWVLSMKPVTLEGTVYDNRWVKFVGHG